jgi:predicted amidohydrolase YtcJ
MEADRGSLEAGKRADLVVLTEDPFSVPTSRLREVTSALTLVGGRVGWSG